MSELFFTKIQPEMSLSHKIEEQIRQAIINKLYLPGDRLPGEVELSNLFGVSRTAVREALRMLSGRGLIEVRKGSGAYVIEMASSQVVEPFYTLLELKCRGESLHHVIQLRSMIEPEIAALAALHRTEDDIEYWRICLDSMKKLKKEPNEMIPHDIHFHMRIAQATQNPIIQIVMEPIYKLLRKFIASTFEYSPASKLAIQKHELLLDCFTKKDPKNAYKIMKQHMEDGAKHIDIYYQKHHTK